MAINSYIVDTLFSRLLLSLERFAYSEFPNDIPDIRKSTKVGDSCSQTLCKIFSVIDRRIFFSLTSSDV